MFIQVEVYRLFALKKKRGKISVKELFGSHDKTPGLFCHRHQRNISFNVTPLRCQIVALGWAPMLKKNSHY